jgi:hypothetical protein
MVLSGQDAEAKDAPPVAIPTDWFQLAIELCHAGEISMDRYFNAVQSVKGGLSRE